MLSHKKEIIEFNQNNFQRFVEVNRPLKENFDIYLFTYRKLYLDGRLFQITLDKDWIDKSPNQGLYLSKEINPKLIQAIETKNQRPPAKESRRYEISLKASLVRINPAHPIP